jgi:hypothetical protein
MEPQVAEVLQKIEALKLRLREPIDKEMQAGGWREESARALAESLEELAAKTKATGELPPISERPRHMARGLDMWGIHYGGPYDDMVALGDLLGAIP